MTTVGIIDYGLGNLTSVAGAVRKLGHDPVISSLPKELSSTDRLILPGVGAFGDGMRRLRDRELVEPLTEMVCDQGKPIFGIWLGSQVLGVTSEEFGYQEGLGWVQVKVRRLPAGAGEVLVPHVGWNDLYQVSPSVLFKNVPENAVFYYVHSYYLKPENSVVVTGECDYGGRFVSAYEQDNIFGTQFHPEKSQLAGLNMLRNFIELA